MPRAHMIYTVPIAITLSPRNISTEFEKSFNLPMVKVRTRDGRIFRAGRDALIEVVKKRIDLDAVFQTALSQNSGSSSDVPGVTRLFQ
jgi:hypothetical protein